MRREGIGLGGQLLVEAPRDRPCTVVAIGDHGVSGVRSCVVHGAEGDTGDAYYPTTVFDKIFASQGAGPGSAVGRRGPLIDSAQSILVTGCCVHDRGRSLIRSASRPATSAMRAARRSGRRVVASI